MSRAVSEEVIPGRGAISVNDPGTEVPESWTRVRLVDIARLESGHTPSRKHPEWWGGDIPWVSLPDAREHHGTVIHDTTQKTNELGLANSAARWLPKDTVCLSRTASVGYVFRLGRPMATSQDFVNWVCSEALEPRFLMQALLAEGKHLLNFGMGTTHTTIYFPAVLAFHITLAPLAEQRRIVDKVEVLLEQVNRAKGRLERVPLILKRFRQAVLAAASSGDLTREWRVENDQPSVVAPKNEVGDDEQENSDTLQPELPSTWAWVALDDACEKVIDYRGRTPPTSPRGRIPHVRTTNVRRGKIDWNTESFVTEEVYGEYMTRGFPKVGDVIFTMEAPMGDAGVVDSDRKFSLAQRLLLLRGKPKLLDGGFLAHMLQASPVRRAIEHRATGTTVLGIAYKRFKYVRLPIAPIIEQKEIVRRVDKLFALADAIECRVRAATIRANKLPQAILSKAFSGELVPTEAELARAEGRAYETAEELLARVVGNAGLGRWAGAKKPRRHERRADA
jgi:type I restriction enzyme S subunit